MHSNFLGTKTPFVVNFPHSGICTMQQKGAKLCTTLKAEAKKKKKSGLPTPAALLQYGQQSVFRRPTHSLSHTHSQWRLCWPAGTVRLPGTACFHPNSNSVAVVCAVAALCGRMHAVSSHTGLYYLHGDVQAIVRHGRKKGGLVFWNLCHWSDKISTNDSLKSHQEKNVDCCCCDWCICACDACLQTALPPGKW